MAITRELSKAMKDKASDSDMLRDERLEFARGIMADKATEEIIEAFCSKNIQVTPFKGVLYRHLLYKDPAQRLMTDIDLIVPDSQYSKAIETITALGYITDESEIILKHPRSFCHSHHYKEGYPLLELHRSIAPTISYNRLEKLIFQGRDPRLPAEIFPQDCVHIPKVEVQLVMLALHFRSHYLNVQKHQLEDVRRLCRMYPPNPKELATIAKNSKAAYSTWLMLAAAGVDDLEEMANELAPPFLKASLHKRLFEKVEGGWQLRSTLPKKSYKLLEKLFIHAYYSRDSLLESMLSHSQLGLHQLKTRFSLKRR